MMNWSGLQTRIQFGPFLFGGLAPWKNITAVNLQILLHFSNFTDLLG